jgi:hypothetical protein
MASFTASTTSTADNADVHEFLTSRGWSKGLREALLNNVAKTPVRYFVCDDSTSMESEDGKQFIGEGTQKRIVRCTRWAELRETLKFHVKLSSLASVETEFRLLNSGLPVTVGVSAADDAINVPQFESLLDQSPSGGTPLCHHVNEIVQNLTQLSPLLRKNGSKAAIIICTDGEPSDGDISEAMRPLSNLPCYVVIRLCTDQASVIRYWNDLGRRLELYIDVIDDPISEAQEIALSANNWFTYSEPIHRLREFGCPIKEYYSVDLKRFDHAQMKSLCCLIFGCPSSELPHPVDEWKHFIFKLSELNDAEGAVWDPVSKEPAKWIDMRRLITSYSPNASNTSTTSNTSNTDTPTSPTPTTTGTPPPPLAPPPPALDAPTATIFEAIFPHTGALGLTLLPYRLTFPTPTGDKALACTVIQASKFSSQIGQGDILLSVNNTPLVHIGAAEVVTDAGMEPYFDHITGSIGAAVAPKALKIFRFNRPKSSLSPSSMGISIEEARAIALVTGVLI